MDISFTDRELDVMAVLWQRGSGTVTEVRDALDDELAYTTVLTVLRTLEDKGYVTHTAEGKAHRYVPAVTQHAAGPVDATVACYQLCRAAARTRAPNDCRIGAPTREFSSHGCVGDSPTGCRRL